MKMLQGQGLTMAEQKLFKTELNTIGNMKVGKSSFKMKKGIQYTNLVTKQKETLRKNWHSSTHAQSQRSTLILLLSIKMHKIRGFTISQENIVG